MLLLTLLNMLVLTDATRTCVACNHDLPNSKFSQNQIDKSGKRGHPKCKHCVRFSEICFCAVCGKQGTYKNGFSQKHYRNRENKYKKPGSIYRMYPKCYDCAEEFRKNQSQRDRARNRLKKDQENAERQNRRNSRPPPRHRATRPTSDFPPATAYGGQSMESNVCQNGGSTYAQSGPPVTQTFQQAMPPATSYGHQFAAPMSNFNPNGGSYSAPSGPPVTQTFQQAVPPGPIYGMPMQTAVPMPPNSTCNPYANNDPVHAPWGAPPQQSPSVYPGYVPVIVQGQVVWCPPGAIVPMGQPFWPCPQAVAPPPRAGHGNDAGSAPVDQNVHDPPVKEEPW